MLATFGFTFFLRYFVLSVIIGRHFSPCVLLSVVVDDKPLSRSIKVQGVVKFIKTAVIIAALGLLLIRCGRPS
ncbi:hypothetical protein BGW37DRAFT_501306 [Umbelopsis sp. PMI_123]|nr:hypothetical protein BGW37DRAFT_501306 [Umbelopsis sp. PMI_123]